PWSLPCSLDLFRNCSLLTDLDCKSGLSVDQSHLSLPPFEHMARVHGLSGRPEHISAALLLFPNLESLGCVAADAQIDLQVCKQLREFDIRVFRNPRERYDHEEAPVLMSHA